MKYIMFLAVIGLFCPFSMGSSSYDKEAGKEVRAISRANAPILLKMKPKRAKIGGLPKGYEWREPYGKPCRQNDYTRIVYKIGDKKKKARKR